MKKDNMDATVGATLYIKTKLLLNEIKDLSIKDMLRQMGLDVDKPFKVSLDKDDMFCGWLKYELEDKTISFRFDEVILKNDNKKSLTIDVIEGEVWEKFLISKPRIGKTRLSRLKREIKRTINLEIDMLTIEEKINRGLTGIAKITLKISKKIIDDQENNERIIEIANFDFSNWNEYALCDIKLDTYKKLLELINRIRNIQTINILDIYQEICDVYGLDLGRLKSNFHVNFKFVDENNGNSYYVEEKADAIEVRNNGRIFKYVREVHNGVCGLKRTRGRNPRS